MPKRIQLQRTAGWRKPVGAFVVSRPSMYGNPFPVDVYGQEKAVDLHRRWLAGEMSMDELSRLSTVGVHGSMVSLRHRVINHYKIIRGHDLCCWCRLEEPCHADTLIKLANS